MGEMVKVNGNSVYMEENAYAELVRKLNNGDPVVSFQTWNGVTNGITHESDLVAFNGGISFVLGMMVGIFCMGVMVAIGLERIAGLGFIIGLISTIVVYYSYAEPGRVGSDPPPTIEL